MRQLFIEEWIQRNIKTIPDSSTILLRESISSYKANAYRAAIVMAWIAFLNIIKERLIIINSPPEATGLTKENWLGIKKDLENERKWDDTVLNLLLRKNKTPFMISEEDQEMIRYWRDIRNICAHGKRYTIHNFHVEAFWQFLIDFTEHRLKIYGEVESILPDVIEVYKAFGINSPDFKRYLQEVLDRLAPNNIHEFLEKFEMWLSQNVYSEEIAEYRFLEFLATIYDITNNPEFKDHHEVLLKYINENPKITPEMFITYHPQSFEEIVSTNQEGIIPKIINKLKENRIGEKEFSVFLYLLKYPCLDETTKERLSKEFSRRVSDNILSVLDQIISDDHSIEYKLLIRYRFLEHLKDTVLSAVLDYPTDFWYANNRSELSVWIIKVFGLEQDFVKKIVELFSKDNYPYEVARALKKYFATNLDDWKKFKEIAIKNLGYTEKDLKNLKINPKYSKSNLE
ncbi:hypothetical protein [Thermococcus sp. 9N3]|uniref:hypothetical protein n=1 Tax=Thermococcus sp. 9N3 TaxID=163002 RepID=UPI0014300174|nr:hypothetical protein [Thermococcus sp. 9N3]NJE48435.1 hypothetical protein [Thermococcus sp. 9N3]